ncbi:MAG: 50S ribosomal protein L22 [Armatimonadetes bacterium]|nr:50S ribosomal protein L22 [Armatimonadota bacterium]
MLAIAKARFVRTSPRKARLVIDAIRGKDLKEALAILQFTPNFAARLIEKVVKSAAANAENNHHMDPENLRVALAVVDGGPNVMKRLRYAPMGRGLRIVKRMSHITIGLEETEPKPDKKGRKKPVARVAKAPRRTAPSVTSETEGKSEVVAEKSKQVSSDETKPVAETTQERAPRGKKSEADTEAKGGE